MARMAPATAELAARPVWVDEQPVRTDAVGRSIEASATISAPADRLYAAFTDPAVRERWLTGVPIVMRFAIPPLHLRAAWADGIGQVVVDITADRAGATRLVVRHEELPDAHATRMLQRFWRERLKALERLLAQ